MRVCSSLAAFPISRRRRAVVVLVELSLGKNLEKTNPVNPRTKEGKHLRGRGKTLAKYLEKGAN